MAPDGTWLSVTSGRMAQDAWDDRSMIRGRCDEDLISYQAMSTSSGPSLQDLECVAKYQRRKRTPNETRPSLYAQGDSNHILVAPGVLEPVDTSWLPASSEKGRAGQMPLLRLIEGRMRFLHRRPASFCLRHSADGRSRSVRGGRFKA